MQVGEPRRLQKRRNVVDEGNVLRVCHGLQVELNVSIIKDNANVNAHVVDTPSLAIIRALTWPRG